MGPFFAIGLPWEGGPLAVARERPGAITLSGIVYDGDCLPVPDSLIETWQADPEGRFADLHGYHGSSDLDGFRGFARAGTDERDGRYEIVTVEPGRVPWSEDGQQAPHIAMSVFARGMLHRLVTRIYFADEAAANAEDPILARVPQTRRSTLIAEPTDGGYNFDIHLQGPNETVFFAI